jgi:hypothetical protein
MPLKLGGGHIPLTLDTFHSLFKFAGYNQKRKKKSVSEYQVISLIAMNMT